MTSSDIASLLARVREATGPDREIDRDLHCAAYAEEHRGQGCPPAYTSSLDAIVALIERELPGWAWKVTRDYTRNNYCAFIRSSPSLEIVAPAWAQTSSTAPIALCAAFLSALSALSTKLSEAAE